VACYRLGVVESILFDVFFFSRQMGRYVIKKKVLARLPVFFKKNSSSSLLSCSLKKKGGQREVAKKNKKNMYTSSVNLLLTYIDKYLSLFYQVIGITALIAFYSIFNHLYAAVGGDPFFLALPFFESWLNE